MMIKQQIRRSNMLRFGVMAPANRCKKASSKAIARTLQPGLTRQRCQKTLQLHSLGHHTNGLLQVVPIETVSVSASAALCSFFRASPR